MTPVVAAGYVIFAVGEEYIEVLLLQHSDYWGFAKGHHETGETLLDTARRELEEETGLELLITSLDPIGVNRYEVVVKGEIRVKEVTYFAGITAHHDVILSKEHAAYEWLHYRAAYRRIIYPELRQVLQKAWQWLKGNGATTELLARNLSKLD